MRVEGLGFRALKEPMPLRVLLGGYLEGLRLRIKEVSLTYHHRVYGLGLRNLV